MAPRSPGRGGDLAPPAKPGPDMYLGLLVISLMAQILAALFLYMDYSQYPEGSKGPNKLQPLPAIGGGTAAVPPGGASGAGALGGGGAGALGAGGGAPAPTPAAPQPAPAPNVPPTAAPKKG